MNIFLLQWNVCFNYFIHMVVGARDKGTDTGRNTININQLIVVIEKFKRWYNVELRTRNFSLIIF